jgi:hypothetical protein
MKRFKYVIVLFSLFLTFALVPVATATESKVSTATTTLLYSVNANPSREGTDIFVHWLQKAYPGVSFSVAYTQDYFMAVDVYDKSEYNCITLNPEAMGDTNAANFRSFNGSVCSDVLKVLGRYVTFESYLSYSNNLLLEIQKSIYSAANLNNSKDLASVYLDNALTARVLPPELEFTQNGGELMIGSTLSPDLLYKLNVFKDASGFIVVEISNLSEENNLGKIELFTGEFPASELYLSVNPTFNSLVGNEQFAYGLKSILEGISMDKLRADKANTTAYFVELANMVTHTMPMLMVKSYDNYNFEITTDAGNLCLILTPNPGPNLKYLISKGYCDGSSIGKEEKVKKALVNSEAKRLFSVLVKHATSSKNLLSMKDYNLDLKKYTSKKGIGLSVKGNVMNIFDLNHPSKSATITFTKGVIGGSSIAKSGLKLKTLN